VEGIYCVVGVAPVDPIVAAFQAYPYSDSHFDRDVAAAPAVAAVGIAVVADDSDVAASGADNFVPKIAPVADSAAAAAAAATVDDRDARPRNIET
jgi:hypothetical protein